MTVDMSLGQSKAIHTTADFIACNKEFYKEEDDARR